MISGSVPFNLLPLLLLCECVSSRKTSDLDLHEVLLYHYCFHKVGLAFCLFLSNCIVIITICLFLFVSEVKYEFQLIMFVVFA